MKVPFLILFFCLYVFAYSTLIPTLKTTAGSDQKTDSIFPGGEELLTLLSAIISPDTIVTMDFLRRSGCELNLNFGNNYSISIDTHTPVVVLVANTSTITTSTMSGIVCSAKQIKFGISNPISYSQGSTFNDQFSGNGTIYINQKVKINDSFEDKNLSNDVKCFSNMLSINATFG